MLPATFFPVRLQDLACALFMPVGTIVVFLQESGQWGQEYEGR